MPSLLVFLALALANNAAAAPLPACQTDSHHFRWALKSRSAPTEPFSIIDRLSVARLVAWDVPVARRSDATIDVRERGLYQLTGYLRLVKVSPDDCDLHLQLADEPRGTGPQIIAEIPRANVALQRELAALVGGVSMHPHVFAGKNALLLTITGFAFVDQEHQTKVPTKRGYGHGTAAVATLWEIHPVVRVERAR